MTLSKVKIMEKVMLLLLILLFPSFCYADSIASVTLEGSYYLSGGNMSKLGNISIILESLGNAPMPYGAVNGKMLINARDGCVFSFGEIYFSKPGIYEYAVSREINGFNDVAEDDSVYKVTVEVFNDGTTAVLYHKEGETAKPDRIEYVDKSTDIDKKDVKNGTIVKTGDNALIYKYIIMFFAALIILIRCRFLFPINKADSANPALPDHNNHNI